MVALTLLVASIALADSVNPSTLVPALWIASAPRARGLASFAAGVFIVYLAGGLVLVLGPGPALISALHGIRGPVEHALQAAGGVVVLSVALVLWRSRRREDAKEREPRLHTRGSAFALGAGIMAVELPTAFMYFGAISAILAAHVVAPVEVSLVVLYTALFVTPLLAILVLRLVTGERTERRLAAAGGWVRRAGRLALTGAAGIAGTVLLALGVAGLVG